MEGVPDKMLVRFVRIPLGDGEVEVLATSLTDQKKYPHSDFKKLYGRRWRVETFFQRLKSRLCIDNFTGKSIESIYQDVYSTIFVSGLESLIIREAQEELDERDTQNPLKVNKAVSFHAIKSEIVDLILNPVGDVEGRIKQLLLRNPTAERPGREHPKRRKRERGSDRSSLYFQRYAKKHVF